jgi:hypothetical protein
MKKKLHPKKICCASGTSFRGTSFLFRLPSDDFFILPTVGVEEEVGAETVRCGARLWRSGLFTEDVSSTEPLSFKGVVFVVVSI